MATLTGKTPAQTYKDLMQVSNNNAGIDSTLRPVEDGEATQSALQLSTTRLRIKPATDSTDVFDVTNASGTVLFSIDTTNNKIIAASGVKFSGDGSLLTSVVSAGSGGSSSTVDLSLTADSDGTVGSYANDIILKIGSTVVGRIPSSYANTLPAGIEGQYFLVADNWAEPQEGLIFDGADDKVTLKDYNGIQAVDIILSSVSLITTEQLAYLGTNYTINVVNGAVTLGSAFSNTTIYVDNVLTSTLTANSRLIHIDFDAVNMVGGYIGSDGTNYGAFRLYGFRLWNIQPDASLRTELWNNGEPQKAKVPFKYRWGSQTPIYTSDFSAGVDSWLAVRSTVSGNNDAVSDGTTSKNDVLKCYASIDNSTHYLYRTNGIIPVGNKYFNLTFSYYIPSANTNVDGLRVDVSNMTNSQVSQWGNILTTTGSWTDVSLTATFNNAYSLGGLRLTMLKAGAQSFVGAASSSDDIVYLKDIVVKQLGTVLDIKGKNMGSFGVVDASSNLLNGSTSGSPQVLHKGDEVQYVDTKLAMTGATTLTDIVPKGYQIQSIYFKNTTANAVTGGIKIGTTAGGTDVVSAGTVGANAEGLFTLASDFFSSSADQTLYVDAVTAWNSASIDIIIKMKKVN